MVGHQCRRTAVYDNVRPVLDEELFSRRGVLLYTNKNWKNSRKRGGEIPRSGALVLFYRGTCMLSRSFLGRYEQIVLMGSIFEMEVNERRTSG